MELAEILFAFFDFLKMAIPLTIIIFVFYKAFSPVKQWLVEKYNLSWMKSVILLNFVIVFLALALFYLYFVITGALSAPAMDPDLQYTLGENALMIGIGLVRVLISAVILTLIVLFFEFIASLAMDSNLIKLGSSNQKSRKQSKEGASMVMQLFGVFIAVVIFLLLFLFLFSWVPLGLSVFIFYGGVKEIPLLLIGFI
jgi:hypothetical protein